MAWWDAVFYCSAQLLGAITGVALASLALRGAPAHKAVRYAATLSGIYGHRIAFVAELVISFILMSAILFASNRVVLSLYTHYFAAILAAAYIAFESPLSGMSTNPARTFGPALDGSYWHTLWIYFVAPPLGMLLLGRGGWRHNTFQTQIDAHISVHFVGVADHVVQGREFRSRRLGRERPPESRVDLLCRRRI
jgi:glycerol uptake facilitator-like aquaporin